MGQTTTIPGRGPIGPDFPTSDVLPPALGLAGIEPTCSSRTRPMIADEGITLIEDDVTIPALILHNVTRPITLRLHRYRREAY
jgi:hypothetical protein